MKNILKLHGKMEISDYQGNKVVHVWDYAKDEARLESEMTKDEFTKSEKAKWNKLKDLL